MRGMIGVGCAMALTLTGCERGEGARDQAATGASSTGSVAATAGKPATGPLGTGKGVTIEYDPASRKSKVTGGSGLSGDPKSCAAFRACCTLPDMGLMCGLIEAGGGDCTAALKQARDYIAEAKLKAPAGCL